MALSCSDFPPPSSVFLCDPFFDLDTTFLTMGMVDSFLSRPGGRGLVPPSGRVADPRWAEPE